LQTTDAGVTWNIKEPMPNANDIKFIGTIGYIVSSNGNIYKSENSGENWSLIQTIPDQNFHTLCIVDETTVATRHRKCCVYTAQMADLHSLHSQFSILFTTILHLCILPVLRLALWLQLMVLFIKL
jgi:hypothetical protein